MDFSTPARMVPILDAVQAFMKEHVIPLERPFLEHGKLTDVLPQLKAARKLVKEQGWLAPHMATKHGGAGFSLVEHALLSQELGQSPLGHYVFNCQAPDAGNMEILAQFGTPAQQEQWLKPLVAGELRSCFSMTEPDRAGSNPTWLSTTAKRDGDHYVIDGRKWFTTAADGAAFAVVMAVTNPDAPPHKRASQIIVPTNTPGFRIVRNINVMGHAGEDHDSHAEVDYTAVRVPVANLLGAEGEGFNIAQERLGPGRIHHCMRWLGICERAFAMMVSYAAKRELSPGKPLGQQQTVQTWIANSRAEMESARLLVLHTAWRMEREGVHAARDGISLIKFHVAGVLQRVLDCAIQTHGALGLTDDTPLAWFFRHERAARIYDGPDEVHQMVVAKRYLKRAGMDA